MDGVSVDDLPGHLRQRWPSIDLDLFLRSKRSAQRVLKSVKRFIEQDLRLLVNQEKTAIRHPIRVELRGYGFVSSFRKGEKGKYDLRVAPKSWQRLKLKIKAITRKTSALPLKDRIQRLNSLMYGWLGYFQLGKIWGKLRTLDGWIRNRLRYCIWKQWKKPDRRLRAFRQLGVEEGMAYA